MGRMKETMALPLTQGIEAVIDVDDVILTEGMSWHVNLGSGGFYARAIVTKSFPDGSTKRVNVYLHRLVMGVTEPTQIIRFRDGDTLNCSKSNLRIVTRVAPKERRRKRARRRK